MSQRRATGRGVVTGQLLAEQRRVTFDFTAPLIHMQRGDRDSFSGETPCAQCGRCDPDGALPERSRPRAVWFTLGRIVGAAYAPKGPGDPGGMNRHDGKIWGAWLEAFVDEGPWRIEVPVAHVAWLLKHFTNDELKVPPGLAQWREAVASYLGTIQAEPSAPDNGQPSEGT